MNSLCVVSGLIIREPAPFSLKFIILWGYLWWAYTYRIANFSVGGSNMRSPFCYLGLAYKGLQPTRKKHVHPIGGGRALPLDPTLRSSSPHYQRYASVTTTAFMPGPLFCRYVPLSSSSNR